MHEPKPQLSQNWPATTTWLDYRPDVDGLRAVAILFVLAFHAAPSVLSGGFVGVDIFFVISGFLITRMILVDLAQKNFSFLAFYGRRIRRLFPALIVVILATWLAGWFSFFPHQYASLGRHIVAGAGFASNLLTNAEVGYFDAPAHTKPLLHLWSLGVEEQFYIAFPAVLFLLAVRKLTTLYALGALLLGSFAANVIFSAHYPAFAFYFPATRLWEFLLGGALAWWNLYGRAPDRLVSFERPALPAWEIAGGIGLLLLMAACFLVRERGFPGWWALLPAIGACLVIAAGPYARITRTILAAPPLVFIGLISYPLYLWHWPLLVIGRDILQGQHPRTTAHVAIGVSFLLAWLTYRFVEQPIRRNRAPAQRRRITAAASACLAALGLLGLFTAYRDGLPGRYPDAIAPLLAQRSYGDDFTPTAPIGMPNNDRGPLLITWGDSHAGHLHAGLQRLQNDWSFRLTMLPWSNCPLNPLSESEECGVPSANSMEELRLRKPDIVLLSAFWPQYRNRSDKAGRALRFLQQIGTPKIVLVGPSPVWLGSAQIALYDAFRKDPQKGVPERLPEYGAKFFVQDAERAETMDAIEGEMGGLAEGFRVPFVSPRAIFCNEQGCLVRVGNTAKDLVQIDNSHFSAAGSSLLARRIAPHIFD